MTDAVDYKVEHWTVATAVADYTNKPPVVVTVNDRAATRQAILNAVRHRGLDFVERSDWAAHKAKPLGLHNDWNYTKIALHHAGRSFTCGPAALQLKQIQEEHQGKWPDVGYHYAVACTGEIYEGRDIRFKGAHLYEYNTGVIGIVLLENLSDAEEKKDAVGWARILGRKLGAASISDAPRAQQGSVNMLVDVLVDFFNINQLGGHREFPKQADPKGGDEGKICPGNHGILLANSMRSRLGLSRPA